MLLRCCKRLWNLVILSAKRLPFMLCLRDELQNYYGRKRIRNFSAVNFAKGNDYFLWITLPLAKQIQFVSLKNILPFSNYRERRTFFREFSRVKHSSLPRQTVAFFNRTGNVWSVNTSSFGNLACVFLVMKHRFRKLLRRRFMFLQWMSTANGGFIFLVNAETAIFVD